MSTKQIQCLAGNDKAGWYVQWELGRGFRSAMPDRETAILVSSAADLLEACKALQFTNRFIGADENSPSMALARNAIAKAEGASS